MFETLLIEAKPCPNSLPSALSLHTLERDKTLLYTRLRLELLDA
jgi:hypothetical protein